MTSIYGIFSESDVVFFVLVAGIFFFIQITEKAFYAPAISILYQPLDPAKRDAVIVVSEGWFNSVLLAVSGILLLIFAEISASSILPFIYLMIGMGLVFLWIIPFIYRQYGTNLHNSVTLPFTYGIAVDKFVDRDVLFRELKNEHTSTVEVQFVFDNLTNEEIQPFLDALIHEQSPHIRHEALKRIEEQKYQPVLTDVVDIINNDSEPEFLRGQALITRLALDPDADVSPDTLPGSLHPYLLIAWLRYAHSTHLTEVTQHLNKLGTSSDSEDKLIAIKVLEATKYGDFTDLIIRLIADPVRTVKRATILMAGQRLTPRLEAELIKLLPDIYYRKSLINALSMGHNPVVEAIKSNFDTLPANVQSTALTICGNIGTREAIAFLESILMGNKKISEISYRTLLTSLREAGYISNEETFINGLIEQEANFANAIANIEDPPFINQKTLMDELQNCKTRMFMLISLLYEPETVQEIEPYFLIPRLHAENIGNALEMLDITLHNNIKEQVISALEGQLDKKLENTITADELLASAQSYMLSDWIQICIDYIHNPEEHPMSGLIDKVMTLRNVSIFSEIQDSLLAEMVGYLVEQDVMANNLIFEKGSVGSEVYILVEGEIRIHDGEHDLATLQAGEVIGEMAILDPAPRNASASTITDCRFLVLHQDVLYDLIWSQPQVLQSILRVVIRRLRDAESGE